MHMLLLRTGRMSFLHSRPSHMQPGNSSVPVPGVPSYLPRLESNRYASFSYNCRLAVILGRLQNGLCLVERAGDASRNSKIRLCETLEAELGILADEVVPLIGTQGDLPGIGASRSRADLSALAQLTCSLIQPTSNSSSSASTA